VADTSSVDGPPGNKNSAYARSRLFRFGVWALAGAAILILWHAIRDGMIAGSERLHTIEGIVVEHQSTETSGTNRVRLSTGGTNKIQGERRLHTSLKVRQGNNVIAHFTADEWFPTPKAGWEGQPIQVQYDNNNNIYGIKVAGEVVRDPETTRKNRKIDNKTTTPLMVFLLVLGVPLTLIGYVIHLSTRSRPKTATPSTNLADLTGN
jgi:hypothetical protein